MTPIERLKAWWAALSSPDKCGWCGKKDGVLFISAGGYRYCTSQCEAAHADDQFEL